MTSKTDALYKMLCEHCFLTLSLLNKRHKEFFIRVLWLFLSIKGKINFLQLERYGENCEQASRNQFQEGFESLPFNATLVSQYCSTRTVIALDSTYEILINQFCKVKIRGYSYMIFLLSKTYF